jgi:hypothetical protein
LGVAPNSIAGANGWPEPGFLIGRATLDAAATLRARNPNSQTRGVIPLFSNAVLPNKTRVPRDLIALLAR